MTRRVVAGAALAGALLAACGGGSDDAGKVCVSEAGTTACLVEESGGVSVEAEGFQPGSELGVAGLDPAAVDQVGKVVRIGGNGKPEGKLGYVGSGGQIPDLVVTVQGTSRSGTPVLLNVHRPAS